jgi:hypothetical protein
VNAKYWGSKILPRAYTAQRKIGAGFCCSDWLSNCYAATRSNFGESPGLTTYTVPASLFSLLSNTVPSGSDICPTDRLPSASKLNNTLVQLTKMALSLQEGMLCTASLGLSVNNNGGASVGVLLKDTGWTGRTVSIGAAPTVLSTL